MKTLLGFQEYLRDQYERSVFDGALASGKPWVFHLHGREIVQGMVMESRQYDLVLMPSSAEDEPRRVPITFPKLNVKLAHPAEQRDQVAKLLKTDGKVAELGLVPIPERRKRHHIKNRSLYPLMKERVVVFFTLLEGEMVRGLIGDFSRYEVAVHLKGGLPVTILRHAVYDLVDKAGTCYLKSVQQKRKDWYQSVLARDVTSHESPVRSS